MGTFLIIFVFFRFFSLEQFRDIEVRFLYLPKQKRLCVIGLAQTHVAFKDKGGITAVDFNVGKSDRSVIKVTGKRKKVLLYVSGCRSIET